MCCMWLSCNPELTLFWCSGLSWYCMVIVWAHSKEISEAWPQSAAGTAAVTPSFRLQIRHSSNIHACICATQRLFVLSLWKAQRKNVLKGLQWQLSAEYGKALSHSGMSSVSLSCSVFKSHWHCCRKMHDLSITSFPYVYTSLCILFSLSMKSKEVCWHICLYFQSFLSSQYAVVCVKLVYSSQCGYLQQCFTTVLINVIHIYSFTGPWSSQWKKNYKKKIILI